MLCPVGTRQPRSLPLQLPLALGPRLSRIIVPLPPLASRPFPCHPPTSHRPTSCPRARFAANGATHQQAGQTGHPPTPGPFGATHRHRGIRCHPPTPGHSVPPTNRLGRRATDRRPGHSVPPTDTGANGATHRHRGIRCHPPTSHRPTPGANGATHRLARRAVNGLDRRCGGRQRIDLAGACVRGAPTFPVLSKCVAAR